MNKQREEKLPSGWTQTKIGDIAGTVSGGTPSRSKSAFFGGSIPWVKSGELKDGFVTKTEEMLTELGLESSSAKIFPKGTLCIALYGATVGTVGILKIDAATNQAICGIFLPESIETKFLFYFLIWQRDKIIKLGKGGAQPNINQDIVNRISFPLPPSAEQKRIVGELETQFSRLDEAVKSIKKMQKNLRKLRVSTIKWACEGKLVAINAGLSPQENSNYEPAGVMLKRNLHERYRKWEAEQIIKIEKSGKSPKDSKWKTKYNEPLAPNTKDLPELNAGWAWATVEQLASFEPNSITDGPFGSNLKSEHYTTEGPRVIRLQNIGDGVFNNIYTHISKEHFEKLKKHQVKEGDIVIAALGETLPRACLIPASVGEAIVKADCIRFAPNPELVSNEYINFALNSEPVRSRTTSIVHGVGRPRLNSTEIKSIVLPIPPLLEQKRIAAEIKRRFLVVDGLEKIVETNLKRAENLKRKILQDAFTGKLVEQNLKDEPASALLERIKIERTQGKSQSNKEYKRKQKQEPMKRKKAERRDVIEVLKESKNKLTPEQLFYESGFDPDEVEAFYAELKEADNEKGIEQEKKNDGSVYLTAKV